MPVRTARRVQFPPLQFVSGDVRTATKTYANRSRISESMHSFVTENYTNVICLQSSFDHEVCLEHVEKEVQTVEDMQATKQHIMTNTEACYGCLAVTDKVISIRSDELKSCPLKPSCCNIGDETASNNGLPVGIILDVNDRDLTLAEKSPHLSQKQDLTMCAENASGLHFDIDTPSCEFEPSDLSEGHHKSANEVADEADTCQNMSNSADPNSVEHLHVLSFSHPKRSLDATEDPVEGAICAAALKENMSELPDRYEPSIIACVDGQHSFLFDKQEFFSTLNSLTPLQNRSNNTVLVSDTPVLDYGLSYRQRALKAGNIRLCCRSRKS